MEMEELLQVKIVKMANVNNIFLFIYNKSKIFRKKDINRL